MINVFCKEKKLLLKGNKRLRPANKNVKENTLTLTTVIGRSKCCLWGEKKIKNG